MPTKVKRISFIICHLWHSKAYSMVKPSASWFYDDSSKLSVCPFHVTYTLYDCKVSPLTHRLKRSNRFESLGKNWLEVLDLVNTVHNVRVL